MRPFLIGALCVTLIGCSCPLPPRGVVQTCTSQGCFTRTAATTPIEPKRAPFRPEPAVKAKKVAIAAKPTAARPQNEAGPVEGKPNSRTIMESEVPPSANPRRHPILLRKKQRPQSGERQRARRLVSRPRHPILFRTRQRPQSERKRRARQLVSPQRHPILF